MAGMGDCLSGSLTTNMLYGVVIKQLTRLLGVTPCLSMTVIII